MQLVNFSFRPEVTAEQRDLVLDQIRGWDSVADAVPLKPGAKHPSIQKMYYAYIKGDVTAVAGRLSNIPEIESAAVPAQRYLAR